MMKEVLVISSGLISPSIFARRNLSLILEEFSEFNFNFSTSAEDLCLLSPESYSATILLLKKERVSQEAFKALEVFLMKGGGLLCLGAAIESFSDYPIFGEIIGGKLVSKAPSQPFSVEPKQSKRRVFTNPKRFVTKDSQMLHDLSSEAEVHYESNYTDPVFPVVWSNQFYLGKIVICTLGNNADTFTNPSVFNLIHQSLAWVSKPELTTT